MDEINLYLIQVNEGEDKYKLRKVISDNDRRGQKNTSTKGQDCATLTKPQILSIVLYMPNLLKPTDYMIERCKSKCNWETPTLLISDIKKLYETETVFKWFGENAEKLLDQQIQNKDKQILISNINSFTKIQLCHIITEHLKSLGNVYPGLKSHNEVSQLWKNNQLGIEVSKKPVKKGRGRPRKKKE